MERMEKLSEVREDLDSKVRLTISLIGVGNAGNQVAVRAHKAGYRCARYVSFTSEKD